MPESRCGYEHYDRADAVTLTQIKFESVNPALAKGSASAMIFSDEPCCGNLVATGIG